MSWSGFTRNQFPAVAITWIIIALLSSRSLAGSAAILWKSPRNRIWTSNGKAEGREEFIRETLLFLRGGGLQSRTIANCSSDEMNQSISTVLMTRAQEDDPDSIVGGGAINEKKRNFLKSNEDARFEEHNNGPSFQGSRNQAHFLHAMEGLERYPNYLGRWNPEDSDELERALEERLEKVRLQRKNAELQRTRLQEVVDRVCKEEPKWKHFLKPPATWEEVKKSGILNEQAAGAIFRSKFFRPTHNYTVPSIESVLRGDSKVELDAGYLEEIMEEEVFDVYSFPLLSESFCDELQAYMRRMIVELEKNQDPDFASGGQRRVRNLDNLGLGWLNDILFQLVVRPVSRHLYSETEIMAGRGADLDWRHGFLAAYSASPTAQKPRQRLVPHTDDAEVTLNVCIGDVFEGGDLQFWGLRGTPEAGQLVGQYTPTRGRALLHAGRQLHEVTEVSSGDRFALIMWTRSWSGVRASTCPCCWLNRRSNGDQSSCICSAKWN